MRAQGLPPAESPPAPFIVGVAASAGGLDPLRGLLRELPGDLGLSIVIAQHLSPHHRSILTDLLSRETALSVHTAEDGDQLAPDTVYVTPANKDITIARGRILLTEPPDPVRPKPSADRLFHSMAEAYHELCAGVVLSGTGTDGAAGARAIKAAGGAVFAQEPASAAYDGMPRAALQTGCADSVPDSRGLAERLARLARGEPADDREPALGDALERIGQRVYRERQMDLGAYREATVQRRLQRRLVATGARDAAHYEQLLQTDPGEVDRLIRELLISVTAFFRDREAFQALETVIGELARQRSEDAELRIWVPGCATGEEAYSIAILVQEALAQHEITRPVQIFATDLDEEALTEARSGIYPAGAVADLPGAWLERYFVREGDRVRAAKPLRDMMVFARQDLLNDPPFTRLDLISCRNLLIYLRPDTQKRILELFHYGLRPGGHLFLGRAEGISGREYLYTAIDGAQRLYRKRNDVRATPPKFGNGGPAPERSSPPPPAASRRTQMDQRIAEGLQELFAPEHVVVTAAGTVLRSRGAGNYMHLPDGDASLSVQALIREELRSELITLLNRCHREGHPQMGTALRLRPELEWVRLRITPLPAATDEGSVCYLILFERGAYEEPPPEIAEGDERTQRTVDTLRGELTATREHLSVVTEELERANEELQSTNEELQSSNEELQSTNEELETSNEELQSTNEELTTVNEELNRRSEELSEAYDDLASVMDSLSEGLVVFDAHARIKRFNAAAQSLLELQEDWLEQPVSILSGQLGLYDWGDRVQRVLREGDTLEEWLDCQGEHHLLRLLPYWSRASRLQGCILLLVNYTSVVRAETQVRLQAQALDATSEGVVVADAQVPGLPVTYCNRSFKTLTGYEPEEAIGHNCRFLQGPDTDPADVDTLRAALSRQEPVSVVLTNYRKDGSPFRNYLRIDPVRNAAGTVTHFIGIQGDVTRQEAYQSELLAAKAEAEQASQAKTEFLSSMSHELRTPLNAIVGFTQLLAEHSEPSAESRQRYYGDILRAGWYLRDLINDVLDLARIEAGEMHVAPTAVQLCSVAEDCLAVCSGDASEHRIALTVEVPDDLWVQADPMRLKQILLNLLTNGIKYNRPGGTVHLDARPEADGDAVSVVISDSGIGIPPEKRERLFLPFDRLDQDRGTIEGTGIGLLIAQRLATFMAGTLALLDSSPERGSRFQLRLPAADPPTEGAARPSRAAESPMADHPPIRPVRILYVEDQFLNRLLVRGLIDNRSDAELTEAEDGASALGIAAEQAFDLILLDLHLPDMDGFQVMESLRGQGIAPAVPVVAVSADALPAQRERAAELGFSDYLVKPFRIQDLERLIRTVGAGFADEA
ncbi:MULTISPECIES: chemotaxis protein CheB [unclassified Halorhodospira]|uniref:chemotaxis protein CheB n=1 Tax=unclassified Halorhodospira TaxID=2626748 RepID=UPI001EE82D79|nr:response regulator [Halorhodospira sp. M39old]MCG5545709.1 response regulator [Halorhodospira sp. M38]